MARIQYLGCPDLTSEKENLTRLSVQLYIYRARTGKSSIRDPDYSLRGHESSMTRYIVVLN